jgi:2-C-methyl-D-erythritol 4-phosphate cytidylyltransferase
MSESIGAIVVAAGSSRRMGGIDKLWLDIDGRPVLSHSLSALRGAVALQQLVVVASPAGIERIEALRGELPWSAITALVVGGAERADSVYAGLTAMSLCDYVLIHDGARPCLTARVVRDALQAARYTGAAIPVVQVTDTIKSVDADGYIADTPDRATLRAVQTPQVFAHDLLLRAYEQAGAARAQSTDDAMLVERLGVRIATSIGDPCNIKVSTPADIPLVRLYLSR